MTDKHKVRRDSYTLFVLIPFQNDFQDIYSVISNAAKAASLDLPATITCSRADEGYNAGTITRQTIKAIKDADLLIADISGADPNVMYELGLAHALGKPNIVIYQDSIYSLTETTNLLTLKYDRSHLFKTLLDSLKTWITETIKGGCEGWGGTYGSIAASVSSTTKDDRNRVFISYSHADSEILKRILIHLKPLEKQGVIDLWVDSRIKAGEKWEDQIKRALASAKVGILLISADFLASDFIVENELPPLLAAAEQEGTKIVPVIVKPSRFLRDKNLAIFQALNDPARPAIKMNEVEREELFVRLAEIVEFYHT